MSIGNSYDSSELHLDPKETAAKLSREITSKITPEEKSQMESDGGIDKNELNTVLFKSNIKPSAEITKIFNGLDKNKNGKLEESELSSSTKGGKDYFFGGLFGSLIPVLIQNLPQILQVGGQVLQGVLSQQGSAQPGPQGGDYSELHSDQKQIAAELSREITSKITPEVKIQMESDGGIDTNELNTILSKSNIKPSAEITKKFNELDTNKNGKVEKSEVSSQGEDYFFGGLFESLFPVLIQNLPQILQLKGQILQGLSQQLLKQQGSAKPGPKGREIPVPPASTGACKK